jgi:thioesterase domain-containing protein
MKEVMELSKCEEMRSVRGPAIIIKNNHLRLLNDAKNKQPIYIIPGTGGRCERFKILARTLEKTYSVYGINLMGTLRGESPLLTIRQIAAKNLEWILNFQPQGPYYLIGHSFGALIMYEMVLLLEQELREPGFNVVLDQSIKVIPNPPQDLDKGLVVLGLVKDYFESFRIIGPPYPEWTDELIDDLDTAPMESMVPYVASFVSEKLPKLAPTIEYVSRLINLRFYNSMMGFYPMGNLTSEVIVMRAKNQDWGDLDDYLGWSLYAKNVKSLVVPGTHHDMMYGKNVRYISQYLQQRIANFC